MESKNFPHFLAWTRQSANRYSETALPVILALGRQTQEIPQVSWLAKLGWWVPGSVGDSVKKQLREIPDIDLCVLKHKQK